MYTHSVTEKDVTGISLLNCPIGAGRRLLYGFFIDWRKTT